MKQAITTSLLLLLALNVPAQVTLQLRDVTTQEPIQGAQVTWQGPKDRTSHVSISNEFGIVEFSAIPIKYEISHISFNTIQDSLFTRAKEVLLTPIVVALNEVVVTGQYAPQSAKNAIYKVRTITRERINGQGATTLRDVLSNELNIRFSRDNALGTSGISMQGISGQNVKVLIDGVPVTGRSGVANEIDINQLNVNSIDRIEIVEGPMAVNYGADALAGVINIITKKDAAGKVNALLSLHEETVENEYTFFDEGIHNPSLSLGFRPSQKWYLQGEGRMNTFGGWTGNGTDRNRQWYPKEQYFGSSLVRYDNDDFTIYYRLDFLDETIENLGSVNDTNPLRDPFAIDEEYKTQRWMHQVQAEVELGSLSVNPVLAYTDYQRITRQFNKNLVTDDETPTVDSEQDTIYFKTLFFRNTLDGIKGNWGSLQLGVDGNYERAAGTTLNDGEKTATDIALFASAEIKLSDQLTLRPGIRYGYNSIFEVQPTPSVNLKYNLSARTQLRAGYARGFRVPSLRELYHEFIDANHNIVGNEDLTPEYSHNFNADLSHEFNDLNLKASLSGFYNYIDNRITFFTPEESNQATSYVNLLKFKTTGVRLTGRWEWNNFSLNSGAAYTGRFQRLSDELGEVPAFIFGWEANASLNYHWEKPGLKFATFYKYNGPFKDYRLVTSDGQTDPELQQLDGFHLMDLTITKSIREWITVSLGTRNLLNINSVNNTFNGGGAHSGGSGSTSVAYGRSYFLTMNIRLESNK
ncbi:TonB-dependent receptor [Fulvivirga sp. M361]|uniref:TonB-dependent receptor plug domain-containing protein n=1 Tax=Fulvivirga sp. M361 TaxID=2594266 RepID=UPI00117AA5BE|nr:TonB-dependent receptor [Fulvivirga sp. M361]TRX58425.1 TonB-dependent receptor [Fulvivirga sp. M361]